MDERPGIPRNETSLPVIFDQYFAGPLSLVAFFLGASFVTAFAQGALRPRLRASGGSSLRSLSMKLESRCCGARGRAPKPPSQPNRMVAEGAARRAALAIQGYR